VSSTTTLGGIWVIWLRYFDVYRKNLAYGLVTTFVEPLLFLVSFGFGLGALIGTVEHEGGVYHYRQYILSGLVGQTIMFQSFFEGAYGGYIRMYYQKIFKAMSLTPITLSEVLWAELLWDSTRAVLAAGSVLLIGWCLGDFRTSGVLVMLGLTLLLGLLFSGLGLLVAATSTTIENISFPQNLLIFPMFLFCGIYYPLETLPDFVLPLVYALPLTPVVLVSRHFLLGTELPLWAPFATLAWTVALVHLSRRKMTGRIVK
jgi:lipooligosaccharide transport system permease protein